MTKREKFDIWCAHVWRCDYCFKEVRDPEMLRCCGELHFSEWLVHRTGKMFKKDSPEHDAAFTAWVLHGADPLISFSEVLKDALADMPDKYKK